MQNPGFICYSISRKRKGGSFVEKIILTLKNIYMMLMNDDFPIYSESVIGRAERRGYTMLRFWRRCIAEDYRSLPCGKMIWRDNGKRNRYTSYLCNRSAEIKTYTEYAAEISSQVCLASLLNQIDLFSRFLSEGKYKHDVLLRRIHELIRLTEAEDARLSPEIASQIREAAAWQSAGMQSKLFLASYLLTLLTLYAAAGEAMGDPVMAVLRKKEFGIEVLWEEYNHPQKKGSAVSFLTVHSGLMQDNVLPKHQFFGQQEELFNLKEIAASGRKCLIQGIGGIGKTELLRQLIRICEEERTVDQIAVVTFEGDLIESFARCFPDFQWQDPESGFRGLLYQLKKESAQGKVLLMIDNYVSTPESDAVIQQLRPLPCGIILTTRRADLAGFEAYTLDAPTPAVGSLIFRDNYGHPLNPEEQKLLTRMLSDDALCYPLILRLMARAAWNRGWSVQELKTQLENKDSLVWQEDHRTVRLNQILRQLYSYVDIPEDAHAIAERFTLLPRDSYPLSLLIKWFPDVFDTESAETLEALTRGGWLDRDTIGYSMHPLIAQCLRRSVITEDRMAPMMRHLSDCFASYHLREEAAPENSEYLQICGIIKRISALLSGNISGEWLMTLAEALGSIDATPQAQKDGSQLLRRMESRCKESGDACKIQCLITWCRWLSASEEEYSGAYSRQKEKRTIPEPLFLDLCLYGGYCAVYQHGNYPLAEELFGEVLDHSADPRQLASVYSVLIDCVSYQGKHEEALQLSEKAVCLVRDHEECGEILTCGILSRLLQCYSILGRLDAAGRLAPELINKLSMARTALGKYHLLTGLTSWSLDAELLENALDYATRNLDIVDQLRGRTMDYYASNGEIALILQRMNRFEEAAERYEQTLSFARQAENGFWIQNTCNNLSVVWLETDETEKALACLDEALPYARPMGGLALGAVLRNRARAFGQLGDAEKEYACLKEACPLLEAAYGPDHPRTVAAVERLWELNASMKS